MPAPTAPARFTPASLARNFFYQAVDLEQDFADACCNGYQVVCDELGHSAENERAYDDAWAELAQQHRAELAQQRRAS